MLSLVYTQIDAAMPAHMTWLRAHYASGHFIVSGRQIPRAGGIIVATGSTREDVDTIARADPFVVRGLATVRVIEFRASQKADDAGDRLRASP